MTRGIRTIALAALVTAGVTTGWAGFASAAPQARLRQVLDIGSAQGARAEDAAQIEEVRWICPPFRPCYFAPSYYYRPYPYYRPYGFYPPYGYRPFYHHRYYY